METKIPPKHLPGFDWLRAGFICLVVLAHLNLFQSLAVGEPDPGTWNLHDVIRYQVVYLAVPGFLLIATFLQALKTQNDETRAKHFSGLVYLYLFWVGAWTLITHARPEPSWWGILSFILQGGGWAFYFFAELLIVQMIRSLVGGWSSRSLWLGLVTTVSAVAVGFSILVRAGSAWTTMSTYWWPLAFLPVPFAAHLMARAHLEMFDSRWRMMRVAVGLMVVTVLAACIEWRFAAPAGSLEGRPFLPEYLRISPLLGASALVLMSLGIRSAPVVVQFISRNSLGIFCIHVFVLAGVYRKIAAQVHDPFITSLVTCIAILFGGAVLTEVLRRCMKCRLV